MTGDGQNVGLWHLHVRHQSKPVLSHGHARKGYGRAKIAREFWDSVQSHDELLEKNQQMTLFESAFCWSELRTPVFLQN